MKYKEAKFWDKSADRYSKAPVRDEETYQKKLKITRSHFTPESQVFEFGCGTGSTAIAHSPYVMHIDAIDISSKMLKIAQEKADTANIENISFKQSTLEDFDSPNNKYDVVMAHSILHLIKDAGAASEKMFELLKPGGVFVSSTFCLGDANPIWRVLLPIPRLLRIIPYVKILKRADLEGCITSAGFEIVHQSERDNQKAIFIVARKPNDAANT